MERNTLKRCSLERTLTAWFIKKQPTVSQKAHHFTLFALKDEQNTLLHMINKTEKNVRDMTLNGQMIVV